MTLQQPIAREKAQAAVRGAAAAASWSRWRCRCSLPGRRDAVDGNGADVSPGDADRQNAEAGADILAFCKAREQLVASTGVVRCVF